MEVVHTSRETMGQIYLPWLNRVLLVLTVAVVDRIPQLDQSGCGLRHRRGRHDDDRFVPRDHRRSPRLGLDALARRHAGWSVPRRRPRVPWGESRKRSSTRMVSARTRRLVVFIVMTTWRRGRELVIRELKQAWPRAQAVHRIHRRASAAARAGAGRIPDRAARGCAACAAAQPQAQQGAARAERGADGGVAGNADGGARGTH